MRTTDADILIVPGLGSSGSDHWQSRWEAKLSSARRVEQDDWKTARIEPWAERVGAAIDDATKPVVLVAHSFGGLAAAQAAARSSNKVVGAFIVAPPSERALRAMIAERTLGGDPSFRLPDAPLAFPSVVVASRNDPFSTFAESEALAAAWGSTIADAGEAGHINVESGHGPWPEGLLRFTQLLKIL